MILLGWLAIAYGFHLLRKLTMANTPVDFMGSLKGAALLVVAYSGLVSLALFYFKVEVPAALPNQFYYYFNPALSTLQLCLIH